VFTGVMKNDTSFELRRSRNATPVYTRSSFTHMLHHVNAVIR